MNLVTDIGNTACKAAVFREGDMIASRQWDGDHKLPVHQLLDAHPDIRRAIVSTVRKDDGGIKAELEKRGIQVMILDDRTPLPLHNRYRTPATLGKDRLAAAVGANARFPGQNLLIIDAGTAITIDFVSSGNEYMGGNISPGLSMRFGALHHFTDNLPLVKPAETDTSVTPAGNDSHAEPAETDPLLGEDTESAIRAGVQSGIIFELDEYINRLKIRYPDLQVIMTGGDAMFFDKKLKNSIFVDPDLNLRGLLGILDYNVGI